MTTLSPRDIIAGAIAENVPTGTSDDAYFAADSILTALEEALDKSLIQPNGDLYSLAPWVSWHPDSRTICLDGDFDALELLAMAAYMIRAAINKEGK